MIYKSIHSNKNIFKYHKKQVMFRCCSCSRSHRASDQLKNQKRLGELLFSNQSQRKTNRAVPQGRAGEILVKLFENPCIQHCWNIRSFKMFLGAIKEDRLCSAKGQKVENFWDNQVWVGIFVDSFISHSTLKLGNFGETGKGRVQKPPARKLSVEGGGVPPLSVNFFPLGFWEPTVRGGGEGGTPPFR